MVFEHDVNHCVKLALSSSHCLMESRVFLGEIFRFKFKLKKYSSHRLNFPPFLKCLN